MLVLTTAIAVFFLLSGNTLEAKQEGEIRSWFHFYDFSFLSHSEMFIPESKRNFIYIRRFYDCQQILLVFIICISK